MKGSHAPSLRTIVARTLSRDLALEGPTTVLCACSGGPDSTAMLHVLATLASDFGLRLFAHGVDHGLRPEATGELSLVEGLATSLSIPFGTTRVEVAPGGNLQARARAARFEALEAAARDVGAAFIATAHTRDDRAETVLLRLLRGSGARGLAVLPPREGARLRPLVRASREDVLRHLERRRISFAEDPSNLDTRFARVRVRREILPALRELSPSIDATLADLADELRALAPSDDPLAILGRRQREQVETALTRRPIARVRVSDCKELLVKRTAAGPVVIEAQVTVGAESARRRGPRSRAT